MSSFLKAFFAIGIPPPQSAPQNAPNTVSNTASSYAPTISYESTPVPTNSPTISYSVAPSEISEPEPECSPPESESELTVASTVPPFNENKVYEELMKNIPKFDGSSNITKFLEFTNVVEDFAEFTDIRPVTLLSLATSKLSDNARL
jgi:hypothetical protein